MSTRAAEARAAQLRRLRMLLILVPFTFPGWLRLRRSDPAAAEKLVWEAAINIAQSLIAIVVVVLAVLFVAYWEAILIRLGTWLADSGVVKP